MRTVFIDESGDHNLDLATLDNQHNIFALAAVCFTDEDYLIFDKRFREVKLSLFGTDSFIIHTAEITRPNRSKNPLNLKFNDPLFRYKFYTKMIELIQQTNFCIQACIVQKDRLIQQYVQPHDPYHFSFENVLNKILRWTGRNPCKIYPEKRDRIQNLQLEHHYLGLKITGTKFYKPKEIEPLIEEFVLKDKALNLSGNQLADLIVSPIARHHLKRPEKKYGNEIPYKEIKKKIRGETVFPFPIERLFGTL
jgi:hypothetical protein